MGSSNEMSTLTEEGACKSNCKVYIVLQAYFSAADSNDYSCLSGHFTLCQAYQCGKMKLFTSR